MWFFFVTIFLGREMGRIKVRFVEFRYWEVFFFLVFCLELVGRVIYLFFRDFVSVTGSWDFVGDNWNFIK